MPVFHGQRWGAARRTVRPKIASVWLLHVPIWPTAFLLCQLWSPVRHAVERNHAAAAEWLLQHASADAELADPTGCRPLHRAVRHWPAQYGTGHRLQTTAPRGALTKRKPKPKPKPVSYVAASTAPACLYALHEAAARPKPTDAPQ